MKRWFLKVGLVFAMVVMVSCLTIKRSDAYYGGLYGGMMGGYGGLYGGMMGLYGGMYGMMGGMYSPFSLQNMYYPVETGTGLTYQIPFMQIAPMLGIAGMYNSLFPNLFNPQQSYYTPYAVPTAAPTSSIIVT